MSSFLTLWQGFLDSTVSFLLTEPIIYFVGVLVLFFVVSAVRRLIT